MMFSKLSGRPIATHVPSVARPASVSGASVSSDVGRAAQRDRQQDRDRQQRPQARLQECFHDRAARFLDSDGGARAFGRDLPHRGREALQRRVVVGVALRKHLDAHAAVRRHPVALEVRGQRLQRDRLGLQRGAQLVECHDQARDQCIARRDRARQRPPWRESSAPSRGAPHPLRQRRPAGDRPPVRARAPCAASRARPRRRSGGGFTSSGLSAGSSSIAASASSVSFGSCCSGMKLASVIARLTSGSAESRFASATASASVGARTSIVLGVVSASFMRSSSVATDSAWALRRLSGLKSNASFGTSSRLPTAMNADTASDGDATPGQEAVERRERRIAHLAALAAGAQHREQRGQQRDAGHERDDHAGAGDQAQLRHAAIVGRQKRVEPRRRRRARERQRHADFGAGFPQRTLQVVVQMALGAIADAELDAEIHAEADEQHGERHRDQVERAVDEEPEGRGDRHADQQADQDGDDEATGAKRHPQQGGDHQHRHDRVEAGAFGERRELLVGERHGTGEPNANARVRGEPRLAYRLANRRDRARTGLRARRNRAWAARG